MLSSAFVLFFAMLSVIANPVPTPAEGDKHMAEANKPMTNAERLTKFVLSSPALHISIKLTLMFILLHPFPSGLPLHAPRQLFDPTRVHGESNEVLLSASSNVGSRTLIYDASYFQRLVKCHPARLKRRNRGQSSISIFLRSFMWTRWVSNIPFFCNALQYNSNFFSTQSMPTQSATNLLH